jgi:hypothetical protein
MRSVYEPARKDLTPCRRAAYSLELFESVGWCRGSPQVVTSSLRAFLLLALLAPAQPRVPTPALADRRPVRPARALAPTDFH